MSLVKYEEARPWAKAIKEMMLEKHMPPWPAVEGYGDFLNTPTLSQQEVTQVVDWVEGGAPIGEMSELPSEPIYTDAWQLGPPDLIFKIETKTKSGYGVYDVILPLMKEDRKLKAMDVRSFKNSGIHCVDFYVDQVSSLKKGSPGLRKVHRLVGSWIPGQKTVFLADEVGHLVRAGWRIRAAVHTYKQAESMVLGEVGIYFNVNGESKPLRNITVPFGKNDIKESGYIKSSIIIKEDSKAVAIRPLVRKDLISFEAVAYRPDSSVEVLIWTKGYTFTWQPIYYYRDYPLLPKGTRIEARAYFDKTIESERPLFTSQEKIREQRKNVEYLCLLFLSDGIQNPKLKH
jgi:hypothetical protein